MLGAPLQARRARGDSRVCRGAAQGTRPVGSGLERVRRRAEQTLLEEDAAETAMTRDQIIEQGKRVVRLEREALQTVEERLGDNFAAAVELIGAAKGRVIVSGSGKSGLIGRKIAATLTSTVTPAAFLHPSDSVH